MNILNDIWFWENNIYVNKKLMQVKDYLVLSIVKINVFIWNYIEKEDLFM